MKNIYNIYNGILSDMDDTLDAGDKGAEAIENSYKEKLIHIISAAAEMNAGDERRFRDIFTRIENHNKYEYAICHITKSIRDRLIICSKRKLNVKDFEYIYSDPKEYDFQVSLEYMAIEQREPNIKFLRQSAQNNPGVFQHGKNVQVICLGNATILVCAEFMYIFVDNVWRVVIRLTDKKYNKWARRLMKNVNKNK